MNTNMICDDERACFHCGHLIYDIFELYDRNHKSELYCTHCNISIKSYNWSEK